MLLLVALFCCRESRLNVKQMCRSEAHVSIVDKLPVASRPTFIFSQVVEVPCTGGKTQGFATVVMMISFKGVEVDQWDSWDFVIWS